MIAKVLLPFALLSLGACDKAAVMAGNPNPFYRRTSLPVDPRIEKYPLAEAMPDRPGFARSPYTGAIVDVTGIRAGGLALDPSMRSPHYFRLP